MSNGLMISRKKELEEIANRCREAAAEQTSFGPLLKFVQGDYTLDKVACPLGTRFTANPPYCYRGWVKFVDRSPVYRIGRVIDGFKPEKRADIGDMDEDLWERDKSGVPEDPWKLTYYLPLKDTEGASAWFVTATFGGRKAVNKLLDLYAANCARGLPVIEIGSGVFPNQHSDRTKAPVCKVVGWKEQPGADDGDIGAGGDGDGGGEIEIIELDEAIRIDDDIPAE